MENNIIVNGAWLTVNKTCNNRCGWCYMKSEWEKNGEMDYSLACRIINFLKEGGIKNIVLIGGEPTLYSKLADLIDYISKKDMNAIMISNGRKFADMHFTQRIVENGLKVISFSAKGGDDEQYQKVARVKDGYTQMLEGYFNLSKLGKNVTFSLTIAGDLIQNIEAVVDKLIQDGIGSISINFGIPIVNDEEILGDCIPNPKIAGECYARVYDTLIDKNVPFSFYNTIPLCLIPERVRVKVLAEERAINSCHIFKGKGLIFTMEGGIIPCNHFTSHILDKKEFLKWLNCCN